MPDHSLFNQPSLKVSGNTPGAWLTIDQLADRSGLPKNLLYKLKKDGVIPFLQRCPGGKIRFPPDAVEQAMTWLRSPAALTSLSVETSATGSVPPCETSKPKRLPGRRPRWDDGDS